MEPVIITTSDQDSGPDETVHVFSIDDIAYDMPAHPPANLGLQFLDELGTRGEAAATAWIMREMLGDDGYEALLECRDMTAPQLKAITNGVIDHALAALGDDTQGNRAARRSGRRGAGRGSQVTSTTSTQTSAASTASRSRTRSKN